MCWIFTDSGFASIVEADPQRDHVKAGTLVVRARVRTDLDDLRVRYMPGLGATKTTPERDYPYRAFIARQALAEGFARIALDSITYGNFKSEVEKVQGHARAAIYGEVWQTLFDLERRLGDDEDDRASPHRLVRPRTR